VVNGGRRHAEPQGETFPRSCGTDYVLTINAQAHGSTPRTFIARVLSPDLPHSSLFYIN